MWSKRCLWKICTFNSEKSLAFAICGKCVVKAFNVTIMSSCAIPFLKIIFKHCFAELVQKIKNICFSFAK
jgi:hypothetical protein